MGFVAEKSGSCRLDSLLVGQVHIAVAVILRGTMNTPSTFVDVVLVRR